MVSLHIFLTLEVGMQMILRAFTRTKEYFLFYFQLCLPFFSFIFPKRIRKCVHLLRMEKNKKYIEIVTTFLLKKIKFIIYKRHINILYL
jgi:hypothetical protein